MKDFLEAINEGMKHGWRIKFGNKVVEGYPASVIVLLVTGLTTIGAIDVVVSLYRLISQAMQ